MYLIFIYVMYETQKVAYAIWRLIGLAGVGIVKPIRYFELKTDIFEMLNWGSLNIHLYHENIIRII